MSGPGATPAEGECELSNNSCSGHIIPTGFSPAPILRNAMAGFVHGAYPARLLSVLPLIAIIALLAGCATGIAPEKPVVTSVTSLPPVQVPVPVRCVKEIPPIPDVKIDANATPLQRYFQMKLAILSYEAHLIETQAILVGCATPPDKKP